MQLNVENKFKLGGNWKVHKNEACFRHNTCEIAIDDSAMR